MVLMLYLHTNIAYATHSARSRAVNGCQSYEMTINFVGVCFVIKTLEMVMDSCAVIFKMGNRLHSVVFDDGWTTNS